MEVTDLVAPIKSRRIKQNSQEWFDGEVAEKKVSLINYLRNSKNQNFTLTKNIYKIAQYEGQKLIPRFTR